MKHLQPKYMDDPAPGIVRELSKKVRPAPALPRPKEASCWAFIGSAGGAGVTSLCVQIAHELVQEKNTQNLSVKPRVCLFDLDFENGACAQYLNLDDVISISDLQTNPERIDQNIVKAMTTSHESGFDVFAVHGQLGGNGAVKADIVLAILDCLSTTYDYLILDMPRVWAPWTAAILGGADQINYITELTVPAIQHIQSRKDALQKALPDSAVFNVIINKHNRRSFRNSLQASDLTSALGFTPHFCVGIDNDTVREAINCGEPAGAQNPTSRYVRDVRKIAEHWQNECTKFVDDIAA